MQFLAEMSAATEQCKQGEPPVVQLSEERQVRCWLYADAAEKKEG